MKDLFIFIGPPGSGKGSLSSLCVQKYNWMQLSTGNLCRQHIQNQTAIGKEIAFATKSGNLVSDQLITAMVEDWLEEIDRDGTLKATPAIILDGFPRSILQAQSFDAILKKKFNTIKLHIINFSIADEKLITRLVSRLVCKNSSCQAVYSSADVSLKPKKTMICDRCQGELVHRDDDSSAAIRERLMQYHKITQPLLQFYTAINQPIKQLNAEALLPDVFNEFQQLVGLARV